MKVCIVCKQPIVESVDLTLNESGKEVHVHTGQCHQYYQSTKTLSESQEDSLDDVHLLM